ncbi:MAG: bifunctional diaminohydroxyphosphoribosylaminopyrimidine deaminase/5-amino-6-(5-phosphoribosylamino)uracil reductase RibD [Brevinema sp.]
MHQEFMKRALELAKRGNPSPNPYVGAVIVKDNHILAEGFHRAFGAPHAEIEAFARVPKNTDLSNATIYVTLEPCSHFGKTPPCVDAILKHGVKQVVVASLDPNPLVAGSGIAKLQAHGVQVSVGILEDEAKALNETFFKYITTKEPFVLAKMAMTLDGKIATVSGESKWISSEESRTEVQHLRHAYTAIMVGIGTVLADDPMLTARIPNGRNPIRIVVDTKLRTPIDSQLVQTTYEIPTIIVTANENLDQQTLYTSLGVEILQAPLKDHHIDLNIMMKKLGERGIDSILLEGGGELMFSAMKAGVVDKLRLYLAPKIFGGKAPSLVGGEGVSSIQDAFELSSYKIINNASQDIIIEGYFKEKRCLQD